MSAALNQYLLAFYNEHILKGKPKSASIESLKTAIQSDAQLAAHAQSRLDELKKLDTTTGGRLSQRCYVSHVEKLALEEALA